MSLRARLLASVSAVLSSLCAGALAQNLPPSQPAAQAHAAAAPKALSQPSAARSFRPSLYQAGESCRVRAAPRRKTPRLARLRHRPHPHWPPPYETGAPNVAGGAVVAPTMASQMTVSRRGPQRPPGHAPRRDRRSGAGPDGGRCTPTPARPISITCAAGISITAPTSPRSSTTCRSICRPMPTARATPTSTG